MNLRFAILLGGLLSALAFLQYRLWFESGGIRDMLEFKQAAAIQLAENDNLRKNNDELLQQIERLHTSREEAELRARNELGMIKKDEVFYQIVK